MLGNAIVPILITFILIFGMSKGLNVFDVFVEGAKDGMKTTASILPTLVALLTAVGMFKASGALDILTNALSPLAGIFGIPGEVIPLAILRPISGSGSLVMFEKILSDNGPDSFIGRVASVMQGSTETTFYTMAVYYGAVKISKTRHTLPGALLGDFIGFFMSVIAVKIIFKN